LNQGLDRDKQGKKEQLRLFERKIKKIKQKGSEIREWTEKNKDKMSNMVDPYYKL